MLEAIADFWKPVKRLQAQVKLKTEELQVGSALVFGFVPQPTLSGRRFTVTAINTYKFGPDVLTSFVLSQDRDAGASMIVADNGSEQYLAVSRRIAGSDRSKIFQEGDIDAVVQRADANHLDCREVIAEYKGWVAPHYKREMHGVKGQLYKGDHRAGLITGQPSMDFSYTLMVSDNNEHALEIEQYDDGRIEIYATVYRRMSDVGEVSHPSLTKNMRSGVRLASNGNTPHFDAPVKPSPTLGESVSSPVPEKKIAMESKRPEEAGLPETKAAETEIKAPDVQEHAVTAPIALREFPVEAVARKEDIVPEIPPEIPAPATMPAAMQAAADEAGEEPLAPIVIKSQSQPYTKQEIKAVNKEPSNFVNESIDCELHVANKIIDEAIRQEMRINDVVRRVIGLPVSQQESVQIPVTLTDQDYSLLAIRYGLAAGDHEAIKKRIIEDLGDFSGANKQKKAA
ncbi:MAG: hypothetical protein SFX19_05265 [Alphaproteobacteria bacterium]|nr:hypothetical protein [Alphaproteobacteria bacterium]